MKLEQLLRFFCALQTSLVHHSSMDQCMNQLLIEKREWAKIVFTSFACLALWVTLCKPSIWVSLLSVLKCECKIERTIFRTSAKSCLIKVEACTVSLSFCIAWLNAVSLSKLGEIKDVLIVNNKESQTITEEISVSLDNVKYIARKKFIWWII